ncbi:hypothetical protein ASPCADRAFT_205272 [Aspergillus carbonarius ITEM 5010]|uniref:Uncharacterized protein n=1 Tax=Aspergillus carbonarius (strain ITEM 5010) TaxID=602072 RepID=A0A1R3RU49_ASPC5|nr:hypothetical protein ASPCADRAFT_205272 [Aspergillus carbonarius ITEM 5010]
MHIPVNFRQFDIRQDGPGNANNIDPATTTTTTNNNNTNSGHDSSSSSQKRSSDKNNIVIICVACIIFVLASALMIYFVLRTLRRMDCRPKYLPGKFLKDKWNRWNVGVTYGQVPDGSTSNNQNANATRAAPSERGAEMRTTTAPPAANNTSNVRRDTSVRSVITLPAYSASPKPTEQVIAREGEREGMDMVVEFPETAEEEENRREEMMESLYQIRLQRRDELAEREWRRQERREARERGDYIRVEQLRQESRARQRNRISANGIGSNLSAALAESRNRGRERRISSVSYAELGHVRHDGSRIRASSPDSDRRPLLNDASGANTETPDRSSGSILTGVHSRGESYSSYQSGTSDADTLTHVQSHATSTHSADHPSPGTDESDVGALHIPPPEYEDLDWGEAPPYTSPTTETSGHAPQLRELTTLPTIHIDVASPISNTPTTPTNPLRDEQEEQEEQHSTEQHSGGQHPTEAPTTDERVDEEHTASENPEAHLLENNSHAHQSS